MYQELKVCKVKKQISEHDYGIIPCMFKIQKHIYTHTHIRMQGMEVHRKRKESLLTELLTME